jgi:hypothetical protein
MLLEGINSSVGPTYASAYVEKLAPTLLLSLKLVPLLKLRQHTVGSRRPAYATAYVELLRQSKKATAGEEGKDAETIPIAIGTA